MRREFLKCAAAATAVAAAGVTPPAYGGDFAREKRVDAVAVYLGVVPSELMQPRATPDEDATMHGGLPKGRGWHHVLIAIFDTKSGERVSDVEVSARVEDVGRALSAEKRLDPMMVAGAHTYGSYFFMPGRDPYSIHVKIDRHGYGRSEVTFHYRHF